MFNTQDANNSSLDTCWSEHFFSFIDPLHIKLMLPSGFNLTALNGAVLYVHRGG